MNKYIISLLLLSVVLIWPSFAARHTPPSGMAYLGELSRSTLIPTNLPSPGISGPTATNIVAATKDKYWDEPLSITWQVDVTDGDMHFRPVTNVNITISSGN